MSNPLSHLDTQIANSEAEAKALAGRIAEAQLKAGACFEAEKAIEGNSELRRAKQLADDLAFEESRLASLRNHRAKLDREATSTAAATDLAAKWNKAQAAADKRLRAARDIKAAAADLGRAYRELDAATHEMSDAMPVKVVLDLTEPRVGVDYSLMAAGLRWLFSDVNSARLEGNDALSRVERTNRYFMGMRPAVDKDTY